MFTAALPQASCSADDGNPAETQITFAQPAPNVSVRALKRQSKHLKPNAAGASSSAAKPAPSQLLTGRRLWLFRILAMTLVPLLLLGGLELVLRLAGYGHPTTFFKSATINGEACLVENDKFGLRFFPPELARSPAPVVMRAEKPPGQYRIYLLGESAALGDPAPSFGFGRYLEVLLQERYPEIQLEVVCVAMTAINSHAILPIARECARREGDLWIVYMGNNEMVGPFGAATAFGAKAPPGWLVRLRLGLGRLRLAQALAAISLPGRGQDRGRTWEGMKLFLEHQLAPDDPARETVYQNFRANLEDILRAGERAKIPIVLSTVAVNLKDFAPFAARPGLATGTNLPPDFARLVSSAVAAHTASDWPRAIQAYERAAAMSPRHADIQYRLAQCQLAVSNLNAARARFSQARDDDALPFRTDSRLNAIIQETGRTHVSRGVYLFDAEAVMAAHSTVGISGDESFYEHVHFTFEGNYRLARALAERIAGLLPSSITGQASSAWATQEQCERALGLTDWNRREVYENVVRRLQQPPFTAQPDNSLRMRFWRAQLSEISKQLTATNAIAARELCVEAIQQRPDDYRLRANFAEFLEATHELPRATEEWRRVQLLIPHHHLGHYQVGRLLAGLGQHEEARQWLKRAVALRPDLGAGWLELGNLSFAEDRYEEALQHFDRAGRLLPQSPDIHLKAAKALAKLKRTNEAIERAREAVRLDGGFWEARVFLGEELAFADQPKEAQQEFEAALKLKPDSPLLHLNLGVALFKQGHEGEAIRHFEEALRLEPRLAPARHYLEQLRSRSRSAQ